MTNKSTTTHDSGSPVQRLVGHADIGDCWNRFNNGDIDAGFEWAMHPDMFNRTEYMEKFLFAVKEERELLKLIIADIKRHVDGQSSGDLGFIASRIADFERLPNVKDHRDDIVAIFPGWRRRKKSRRYRLRCIALLGVFYSWP